MSPERFYRLIPRLVRLATLYPRLYVALVALVLAVAYLGTAVILLLPILLVIIVVLPIWLGLSITLLLFVLFSRPITHLRVAVRSIVARQSWTALLSNALQLERGDAVALFDMVEEVRAQVGAPPLDGIILSEKAALWVIVGGVVKPRRYLVIGLPALHMVTPEQMRALIAEQLVQIVGSYHRLIRAIEELQEIWDHLVLNFDRAQHWGRRLGVLFSWCANYLMALAFPLNRVRTLEADQRAAALFGVDELAGGLVRLHLLAAYLEQQFWPALYEMSDHQLESPTNPFHVMAEALRTEIDPEQAKIWINEEMAAATYRITGQPPLAERLAQLGWSSQIPSPPESSAARQFLGASVPGLTEEVDRRWVERTELAWQARHERMQSIYARMEMLAGHIAEGKALDAVELWDYATWIEKERGAEEALPYYRRLIEVAPDHAGAHFAVGRILLGDGSDEGIAHIERAFDLDEERYLIPGVDLVYNVLRSAYRTEEAEAYADRHRARYQLQEDLRESTLERAKEERSRLLVSDTYLPHELLPKEVEFLGSILAEHPRIEEAYLVRKQVEHLKDQPFFVVGIKVRRAWHEIFSPADSGQLVRTLLNSLSFLGDVTIVVLNDPAAQPMREILKEIPDARVYAME